MRMIKYARAWLLIVICLTTLMMTNCMAESLSPAESHIISLVKSQSDAQQQFLKKLVNINSGTTNPSGVRRVSEQLRQSLKKLGFTVHLIHEPARMHRAPTLIAERHGKKGKRLLLIGHLDTVFPANSQFKQYVAKQNSAKGPGVVDDKGGLVVMLYALKALNDVKALDQTSITIVLTGDEEDSGKPAAISRKPLIDAAKERDIALDFEPAMNLETATIGRRGISQWTIETHGNESHSATIFQKDVGYGAIFELARIFETMRKDMQGISNVTYNPGLIAGGTKVNYDAKSAQAVVFGKENVVAKTAMAKGDFRYLDVTQQQELKDKMTAIVQHDHLPGTHAEIAFQDGIPAMSPTDNNRALLKVYSDVSESIGTGEVKAFDPALRGAGDISYVASIVPANLAGLGPVGFGTHSVIESIELPSLSIQTQRAAILIYRLTHSVVE